MKKETLVFLGLIAVAGLAVFFDDVAAWLGGMTPLEAVKQIATFILHVTVGTICAYVVFGLPAIVKPWMRMFRQKRRGAWRAGPNAQWQKPTMRLTAEERAVMLMAKLQGMNGGSQARRPSQPTQETVEPTVRMDW